MDLTFVDSPVVKFLGIVSGFPVRLGHKRFRARDHAFLSERFNWVGTKLSHIGFKATAIIGHKGIQRGPTHITAIKKTWKRIKQGGRWAIRSKSRPIWAYYGGAPGRLRGNSTGFTSFHAIWLSWGTSFPRILLRNAAPNTIAFTFSEENMRDSDTTDLTKRVGIERRCHFEIHLKGSITLWVSN